MRKVGVDLEKPYREEARSFGVVVMLFNNHTTSDEGDGRLGSDVLGE